MTAFRFLIPVLVLMTVGVTACNPLTSDRGPSRGEARAATAPKSIMRPVSPATVPGVSGGQGAPAGSQAAEAIGVAEPGADIPSPAE